MNKYLFKTTATMKPYNNKNWWIDSGIVREITIEADSIRNALELYREKVQERHYIEISKTAVKTAAPMYRDTETGDPVQCGYVITGATDFENDNGHYTKQYIDLWTTIYIIKNQWEDGAQ